MKTLSFGLMIMLSSPVGSLLRAGPSPGRIIGWGSNVSGEATGVPLSEQYYATGLVTISGLVLSNATGIAVGRSHSLALTSDGTVVGWGGNGREETVGFPTEPPYRTNGLVRIDGKILSGVTGVSAGGNFSLAVKQDGTIASWGKGPGGGVEMLKPPPGLSNVVAVSVAWNYSLALTKNGNVVCWGERKVPAGLSNVVAIAAGGGFYAFGLALKRDGTVKQWGPGGLEEEAPAELTNIVSIASGGGHCLALRRDGTVVGWGDNNYGQATGIAKTNAPFYSAGTVKVAGQALTNIVAVAAGSNYSLALRSDGTVVAWGFNPWRTMDVPAGLSNVVAIAAGENSCLAITTNSSIWLLKK